MANSNIDFLRFSAYSMKELITRKLSEDTKFTDQIYEGSNLAILIDIVSYMYQCLAFQLNSAAAESMFADTQLYDNMIRLVQFIGYNPRGCFPAQFTASIRYNGAEEEARSSELPMFTYFVTQKSGDNGPICFSTSVKTRFESDSGTDGVDVTFYNGKWKAYSVVYTSSGLENEVFPLEGLKSDSSEGRYVSGDFIRVVVMTRYRPDGTPYDDYVMDEEWLNDSNGIFTRSSKEMEEAAMSNTCTNIYGPDHRIYTVMLNENKTYEIKFGNGITGRKLRTGDRVFVFYLDTDGSAGEMDLSEIDFSTVRLRHDRDIMESVIPKDLSEKLFGKSSMLEAMFEPGKIEISPRNQVTTRFIPEESVGDIRSNAPGWFKTGNRLITTRDTEYFIKTYGKQLGLGDVVDVKCMNNMQYVATFYKWLYENGIKSKDEPARVGETSDPGKYYLDSATFDRINYRYIDPADANNTYLWVKTGSVAQDFNVVSPSIQGRINDKLNHIKTITTEYYLVKPVLVRFSICANPDLDDIKTNYFNNANLYFGSDKDESYIEITLDDNMIYVSSNIQKLVYDEILKAFDVNSQRLGGTVKYQDIMNSIYAINGVQRVRTVHVRDGDYLHIYDGVSFASWSEDVLKFHEDLQVGNVMRHVEDFQFPVLDESKLFEKIKVITKTMHQVHAIKF